MVRVFTPAVLESNPLTMPVFTGTVSVFPLESVALMVRPATSRGSPRA